MRVFLSQVVRKIPVSISNALKTAVLLGGSSPDGRISLRSWASKGKKPWCVDRVGLAPIFLLVARFLAAIHSRRVKKIWSFSTRSQGPYG